jgi:nucleoid-associated protein YgaU
MTSKNKAAILLLAICLVVFALVSLTWCAWRPPDDIPPTLAISETPSITPLPATATPTPVPSTATIVVAVTVSPTGSGTAVTPLTPPGTVTDVPTGTAMPEATATARPTTIPPYIVQPGDCLACLSLNWFGTQTRWGDIWELNGRFHRPHLIYPGQELKRPK